MLQDEPQLFPEFISEEERTILLAHANHLLDAGILKNNTFGANRYRKNFFSLSELDFTIYYLYNRVINTLNLKNPIIDPALGIVISVIKPPGFIQTHTDKYKKIIKINKDLEKRCKKFVHKRNFRFNVMVDRDEDISYSPHISNQPFVVNIRDAWCFAASELEHNTPPLKGKKNRVVYQFGFAVDQLHQDTSDYDELIYGYNK